LIKSLVEFAKILSRGAGSGLPIWGVCYMPLRLPKGVLPNTTPMWFKANKRVALEVRAAAKKAHITQSEWLRRVVVGHLNEQRKPPKTQQLIEEPETRLLTTKTSYAINAPCLFKNVQMTLKDVAMRLGVSFIYIHNRLKKGDSLQKVVERCEAPKEAK
jgi:hypothetical protein